MSEGLKHILDNWGNIVNVPQSTPSEAMLGYLGRGDEIFNVQQQKSPAERPPARFLKELALYLQRNKDIKIVPALDVPDYIGSHNKVAALYETVERHWVERIKQKAKVDELLRRHAKKEVWFEYGIVYARHKSTEFGMFLDGYKDVSHNVRD